MTDPLTSGTASTEPGITRDMGGHPITGSRQHAVACLFESRSAADAAVDGLVRDGIARERIVVTDQGSGTAGETAHEGGGVWESLKRMFTADDDTAGYYEGVRRGQTLVTVHADSEVEASRAATILEDHHPVDLDTQEASWRKEGWTGQLDDVTGAGTPRTPARTTGLTEGVMAGRATDTSTGVAGSREGVTREGPAEEVIPVVEENLAVGKRDVRGGSVRVRTHVVETPVEEDVRLRDERVHVERRPVDRPADAAATAAFQDRTVEMTETGEEAVVQKTARVTEEVVVRKDVGERTEHVSDKVRRTEVEVEDGTGTTNTAKPTDPTPRV